MEYPKTFRGRTGDKENLPMNPFDDKPLAEIKPEDIRDLVDAGTVEDEELDFKHIPWPDTEDGRFELLHDITALGNAQGGYLLIGIGTRKDAAGRDVASGFAPVTDAAKEAQRIRDICFQCVDPRIQGLEVEPTIVHSAQGDVDVVAIRVPPSSNRPHGFEWRDATIFVRRYGAHVRRMPISELGALFSVRYFPETETNRRLTEVADAVRVLSEEMARLAATVVSRESDALSQTNIDRFLEMMEERFRRRYEGGEHTEVT